MAARSTRRKRKSAPNKSAPKWVTRLGTQVLRWAAIAAFFLSLIPVLWVAGYRFIDPPTNYYMISEWSRLGDFEHNWREIEDISHHLPIATMAAEDSGFCSHLGFDLTAIRLAIGDRVRGERLRGGSTITQQVAKNVFLWPERSWLRKGLEAGFTVLIELFWPKRRIVEIYLNIAEFDEGVFGAGAASWHYFGKSAADLTWAEAALLAATLPAPKERSASRPDARMRSRAADIARGASDLRFQGLDECIRLK